MIPTLLAIPTIFTFVKSSVAWLSDEIDKAEIRNAEKKLKDATDQASKEKNTSKLDQLFKGGK